MDPLYQMVSPAALWSSGSATAYPANWLGLVVFGAGAHEQPAGAEPVKEVVFVGGRASGGVDQAAEAVAGYFVALLAGGLVQLGGLGVALGTVAAAVDAVQAVVLFQFAAAGLRAAVVPPEPDGATVLPRESGDEVDVGLGVADTDRRGGYRST